jgi:hypothetical protein
MRKPIKDLTDEQEATLLEMFDYFCSKIDFGHSFLDNAAIRCMDTLAKELRKDNKKFQI